MTLSSRTIVALPGVAVNNGLRDIVVLVCAASAGVHAALVPEHLAEGGPLLGGAFAASALALAVVAVLARRPGREHWAVSIAVAVLAATSSPTCCPEPRASVLIPEPEEVDLLGVVTTIAEAVGVVSGVLLITRKEQS